MGPAAAITFMGYITLATPLPLIALILAPAVDPMSRAGRILYGILIGSGVMQAVAHIWLIFAIRAATAATVSAFQYSQLVFATAIGIIVFGDWPDQWLLAGAALVVAAGLGIVHLQRTRPVYAGSE